MARNIRVVVDKNSEAAVIESINTLLTETRRSGSVLVKQLARMAANSAANLTIPNSRISASKAIGSVTGGNSRSVRRPQLRDKFRPLVSATEQFHGNFYVIKNSARGGNGKKRKNKRGKKAMGMTGTTGDRGIMRGSRGEMVLLTSRPISQKDKRYKKIKKLIKAWDRKKGRYKYIPTVTTGKWEKNTKDGKIPYYFAAKQAWLWSTTSFSKSVLQLNKESRLKGLGRSVNDMGNVDQPSITMYNSSNYASKRGGSSVPQRALRLALRGMNHMLIKQRERILRKARAKLHG